MIDSRQNTECGLFVAIKGKTDGHAYLNDAWEHGARGALVSQGHILPKNLAFTSLMIPLKR